MKPVYFFFLLILLSVCLSVGVVRVCLLYRESERERIFYLTSLHTLLYHGEYDRGMTNVNDHFCFSVLVGRVWFLIQVYHVWIYGLVPAKISIAT